MIGFTTIIEENELEEKLKEHLDEGYEIHYLGMSHGVWVVTFCKNQIWRFSNIHTIDDLYDTKENIEKEFQELLKASPLCNVCMGPCENPEVGICNSCQEKS